jgi:hypothetical protein
MRKVSFWKMDYRIWLIHNNSSMLNICSIEHRCDTVQHLYGLGEITVVADRGMNSSDNLLFLTGNGYHFVISYTLKRNSAEFRQAVLGSEVPWEVERYDPQTGELEYASKVLHQKVAAKIELTEEELKPILEERKQKRMRGRAPKYRTAEVDACIHVTYSAKRARNDFSNRMRILERLAKKLDNPSSIRAAIRKGGEPIPADRPGRAGVLHRRGAGDRGGTLRRLLCGGYRPPGPGHRGGDGDLPGAMEDRGKLQGAEDRPQGPAGVRVDG